MSDDAVIFGSAAEGLVRALGDKLDDRSHKKFAELGVVLRGRLAPAYPRKAWIAACLYAGELMFPGHTPEEQRRLLGHRFISSYGETIVGKALLTMLRVLGPRRALDRLERSFRTGMSHSDIGTKEISPGHYEVTVSNLSYAEWYQGMIEKGLEHAGARNLEVKVVRQEPTTVTFDIRWS